MMETTAPHAASLTEGPTSCLLSAVSGFVDTAGFILLDGIFTSHVTGNLVLAGAALAGTLEGGALVRSSLVLVFMLAVATASHLARALQSRGREPIVGLLVGEAVMLAIFLGVGRALLPSEGTISEPGLFVVASMGVVAMGIQNALMRVCLKTYLPTTMMTGNTTQLTLDLVAACKGDRSPAARASLRRTATVVSGFVLGAALGALGSAIAGMAAIAAPMLAIAVLAYHAGSATARTAR